MAQRQNQEAFVPQTYLFDIDGVAANFEEHLKQVAIKRGLIKADDQSDPEAEDVPDGTRT